jgi:uncharacterized protein YqeY
MNKLDILKKMKIKAMKEKDTESKSILSVLQSDTQSIAKSDSNREIVDADIVKAAKTLINRNNKAINDITTASQTETDQSKHDVMTSNVATLTRENAILNEFVPQTKSSEEIHTIIDGLLSDLPEGDKVKSSMGKLMGKLKSYGDSMDMKVASKYLSQKLS